ncbi:CLUMA_CG000903, isoform A [Clunio marinus]|uniref:CLUMA_CG000903, isoform A n=1 Tax=Clunio marinus TaxID=568069 RepID=A0A1J1HG79_9DIPT|nr:CLUMA_CG000903, isoform A [Clunio marinus]
MKSVKQKPIPKSDNSTKKEQKKGFQLFLGKYSLVAACDSRCFWKKCLLFQFAVELRFFLLMK